MLTTCESGEWDEIARLSDQLRLPQEAISEIYWAAMPVGARSHRLCPRSGKTNTWVLRCAQDDIKYQGASPRVPKWNKNRRQTASLLRVGCILLKDDKIRAKAVCWRFNASQTCGWASGSSISDRSMGLETPCNGIIREGQTGPQSLDPSLGLNISTSY